MNKRTTAPRRERAAAPSRRPLSAAPGAMSTVPLAETASRRPGEAVATLASKTSAPALGPTIPLIPVRIGYFQPDAREVHVAGTFNDWDARATPLRRDTLGDWSVELQLPPGQHRYRLIIDGEWRDDPSAQRTSVNPFGGFDSVIEI